MVAVAAISLKDVVAPGLRVMGAFHGGPKDGLPSGCGTLVLLGPGVDFWPVFSGSAEGKDGHPDPVDRWSERVISELAKSLGGVAIFPFGGPPYAPFLTWALKSGRAWSSPVGMLVHDSTGLMVSYRGALAFTQRLDLDGAGKMPCDGCARPCETACPVGALGPDGYDTRTCHAFLDTSEGTDCLNNGCKARRACPVSAGAGRVEAQSAHHMRYFHPD